MGKRQYTVNVIKVILVAVLGGMCGGFPGYADSIQYTYDLQNRVQSAEYTIDSTGQSEAMGYDPANNLIRYKAGDAIVPEGDDDSDGLTYAEELSLGTDPFNSDTDHDGLSDKYENDNGLNPLNPDSDGDGLPDKWELDRGLNPLLASDGQDDQDGDGLTNAEEYRLGTDWANPDSDGDGIPDGDEVNEFHTDPLSDDTDNDGLKDGEEIVYSRGIGMGSSHAVAANAEKVYWWGLYPLGNSGSDYHGIEVLKTQNDEDFTSTLQADSGERFSVFLKKGGTVWSCWHNNSGQLGNGNGCGSFLCGESKMVQVIDSDGVGFLENIKEIAVGKSHVLALSMNGELYAWGHNSYGQLGLGAGAVASVDTPSRVLDTDGQTLLSGIKTIAAGDYHSVAIKTDGTVLAWGDNAKGQLGDGSNDRRYVPVQVVSSDGSGVLQSIQRVGAGAYHTLALQADGKVWAWGNNDCGQLGNGEQDNSSIPVQVMLDESTPLMGVKDVDGSWQNSVALGRDGKVWSWGRNNYGQVGNGEETTVCVLNPVRVVGADGEGVFQHVVDISAGWESTMAIVQDGTVWMWGRSWGAVDGVGLAASQTRLFPFQIPGISAEFGLMSDPLNPDSDFDGINDGWEMAHGYDIRNHLDAGVDADGDGLTALQESLLGTDPESAITEEPENPDNIEDVNRDYDGDGMPNKWEFDHGLDPTTDKDKEQDPDNDGLSNIREYQNQTHPRVVDTDADGLTDYEEVDVYETSPILADTDGEGLSDGDEVHIYQTSPLTAHTDGDAIDDYKELYEFNTEPLEMDTDQDGVTDYKELNSDVGMSGAGSYGMCVVQPIPEILENLALNADIFGEDGKYACDLNRVIDGNIATYGGTSWTEQGAMILDLKQLYVVSSMQILLLSTCQRYFNYTVEYSTETEDGPWVMLCDHSKTASRSWQYINPERPVIARYFKLTGLYNSVNSGFQVMEWVVLGGALQPQIAAWGVSPDQSGAHAAGSVTASDGHSFVNAWKIAAGPDHALAIKKNKTLWSWGENGSGQLGNDSTVDSITPVQVKDPSGTSVLEDVVDVASALSVSLALTEDGLVYQWGGSVQLPTVVGRLTDIKQIAAGDDFYLALDENGEVWAWGNNTAQQLGQGLGSGVNSSELPLHVKNADGTEFLSDILQISAGSQCAVALRNDGSVWMWGIGIYEEDNEQMFEYGLPVKMSVTDVKAVSAAGSHCFALTLDNAVWSWGDNTYLQLARSTTDILTPQFAFDGVVAVQATPGGGIAVREDGNVLTWGRNDVGQCGHIDGNNELIIGDPVAVPTQVQFLTCEINASFPDVSDSDNDTILDGWERQHALNAMLFDKNEDPDEDGFDNGEEYVRDTDPQDPDSRPPYVEIAPENGYTPLASSISMVEGDLQTFELNAVAGYGDDITYAWYKNDVLIDGVTENTWTFEADENTSADQSETKVYEIECRAMANGDMATMTWSVSVANLNRAPEIITTECTVLVGDTLTFVENVDFSDPDNQNAVTGDDNTLVVNCSGGWMSGNGKDIVPEDAGSHNVLLQICDQGTPELCSAEKTVQVNVIGPDLEPVASAGWSQPLIICSDVDPQYEVDTFECSQTYYIYVAEANNGTYAAGAHDIEIYLDDELKGTVIRDGEMAIGEEWISTDYPIELTIGDRGEHTVRVVMDSDTSIDALGDVKEANEENNVFERTIQVRGDFSFSCLDTDRIVEEGESVEFLATVDGSVSGLNCIWTLDGVLQDEGSAWTWNTDYDDSGESLRQVYAVRCEAVADGGSASFEWDITVVNHNQQISFDDASTESINTFEGDVLDLSGDGYLAYTDPDDANATVADDAQPRYVVTSENNWMTSISRMMTSADVSDQPYQVTVALYDGVVPETSASKIFSVKVSPFPDTDDDGLDDRWEDRYGDREPNGDEDEDGLINLYESQNDTDPMDEDTDDDGLNDYLEVMVCKTDPLQVDTDGDGQNDGMEALQNHTNPNDEESFAAVVSGTVSYSSEWALQNGDIVVILEGSSLSRELTINQPGGAFVFDAINTLNVYYLYAFVDVNGNGQWDMDESLGYYETFNFYLTDDFENIHINIQNLDFDSDGLPNWVEDGSGTYVDTTHTGTDPAKADTDNDGLSDKDEVLLIGSGYDPFVYDVDEDGWPDGYEYYVLGEASATDENVVPPGNHVVNGDFETAEGWYNLWASLPDGEGGYVFETGRAYGGYNDSVCGFYLVYQLYLMPSMYPVYQTMALNPDVNYVLSYYMNTTYLLGYCGIGISFYKAEEVSDPSSGQLVLNSSSSFYFDSRDLDDSDWTKYVSECPVDEYAETHDFDSMGLFLSQYNHNGQELIGTYGRVLWDQIIFAIDYDEDQMPDYWEVEHGLNPTDASDAESDLDGDFYTNYEEFENDTDPDDSSSILKPVGVHIKGLEDGQRFTAPATINLKALAFDAAGEPMDYVEFYNGVDVDPVATVNEYPFGYTWENVAAGTYSITAKGYNDGVVTESDPVVITVQNAPVVTLLSPSSENNVFALGAAVPIECEVTDDDETIETVYVYFNDRLTSTMTKDGSSFIRNFTFDKPGEYSVRIEAVDCDGAVGSSDTVAFKINSLPYLYVEKNIINDSVPGKISIRIIAGDYEDDLDIDVRVIHDGEGFVASEQPCTLILSEIESGTHSFVVEAEDQDGFVSMVGPIDYVINDAPVIQIVALDEGQVFTDPDMITFNAQVTDDGDVDYIEFFIDGQSKGTVSEGTSYTWTDVTPGDHTIYVRAVDAYGAESVSPTVSFSVDTIQHVAMIDPVGLITVGDTIILQAMASDNENEISEVKFYCNDEFIDSDIDSPYFCEWVVPDAETYTLKAEAYVEGGEPVSDSISVSVNKKPTVLITEPENNIHLQAPGSTMLRATASDDRGVQEVRFYANGFLLAVDDAEPYEYTWTDVGQGTYMVKATVTDSDGIIGEPSQITVNVNDQPVASIVQPVDGAVVQESDPVTVLVEASDPDGIAYVYYSLDNGDPVNEGVTPYEKTYEDLSTGVHTFKVRVHDTLGGETWSEPIAITVNSKPEVALIGLEAPVIVTEGTEYTISAAASDDDGDAITLVEFYKDDVLLGTDDTAPYSVAFLTDVLGTYAITAKAYDERGGNAVSAVGSVRVNECPTVEISNPQNDVRLIAPASLTIDASAIDSDEIALMTVYLNDAELDSVNASSVSVPLTDIPAYSDEYVIRVYAEDIHGASGESEVRFSVNAPPTVSISSPSDGVIVDQTETVMIMVNADDAENGDIITVDYYVNDVLVGETVEAPHYFDWSSTDSGLYVVKAIATDGEGAATESDPISIRVNATPMIEITMPSDGDIANPSETALIVHANVSDVDEADGDAIAKVDFYLDGVLIVTDEAFPFEMSWMGDVSGFYTFRAVAYDSWGSHTESDPVTYIVNAAPVVTISAPVDNRSYTTPAVIDITATVDNQDDALTVVELRDGETTIHTWSEPPYTYTLETTEERAYELTVHAEDENGLSADSEDVTVTVVPFVDSDGDGLGNPEETYDYGTNPDNEDTDGDTMEDGWEVDHGYNPLVADSYFQDDDDEDGKTNGEELLLGTSPDDVDTWYGVTEVGIFDGALTITDLNTRQGFIGDSFILENGTFNSLSFGPESINSRGQVVGSHYLWEDGYVTDLGDFNAHDINEAGEIVGAVGIDFGGGMIENQFARYVDGSVEILPVPGQAMAVNDAGEIAGIKHALSGPCDAVVLSGDGYAEETVFASALRTTMDSSGIAYAIDEYDNVLRRCDDGGIIDVLSFEHDFVWANKLNSSDAGLLLMSYGGYVVGEGVQPPVDHQLLENDRLVHAGNHISEGSDLGEWTSSAMNKASQIAVTVYDSDTDTTTLYLLSAMNRDSDEDGISDYNEVALGLDVASADTDQDGLTDYEETYLYETDALNDDSDGDGMMDGWEVTYNFNPMLNEAADGDPDNDGLKNWHEAMLNTNPNLSDSDGDTTPDGEEDADGDEVSNAEEALRGTSLTEPDIWYVTHKVGEFMDSEIEDMLGFEYSHANNRGDLIGLGAMGEYAYVDGLVVGPFNTGDADIGIPKALNNHGEYLRKIGFYEFGELVDSYTPSSLNDHGLAVDYGMRLYDIHTDEITDLNISGTSYSINNQDQILFSRTENGVKTCYLYQDGQITALPLTNVDYAKLKHNGWVYGVTADHDVIGCFNGSMCLLDTIHLPDGEYYTALEVSEAGDIFVRGGPGNNDYSAVVQHGRPIELKNLIVGDGPELRTIVFADGSEVDCYLSVHTDMNDIGQVAVLQHNDETGMYELILLTPLGRDSDGDGLDDDVEMDIGTWPADPDSDGDGMDDGWEVAHDLDPLNLSDADDDEDDDGFTNAEEYLYDTHPNDINDTPPAKELIVESASPTQSGVEINEGDSLTFALDVTDSWNYPISYEWTVTKDSEILATQSGGAGFGFMPDYEVGYAVCQITCDYSSESGSGSYSWSIEVLNRNRRGSLICPDTIEVEVGQYVMIDYTVDDPDLPTHPYVDYWYRDVEVTGWMDQFSKLAREVGEHQVHLKIWDDKNDEPAYELEADITVIVTEMTDTDGDGMADWYEDYYASVLDKTVNDADLDSDGDGLSNYLEFMLDTFLSDINEDDWMDTYGYDPGESSTMPAVSDSLRDMDHDGMPDWWETVHEMNPYGPIGLGYMYGDKRSPDWQEYQPTVYLTFEDFITLSDNSIKVPNENGDTGYGYLHNGESEEDRTREGVEGNGLRYPDGSSQCVQINDCNAIRMQDHVTVSCWYKREHDGAAYKNIASKGGWEPDYGLVEFDGRMCFQVKIDGVKYETVTGNMATKTPLGKWCHVVGVYDGACISLYLDGELKDSVTVPGGGMLRQSNLPIYINMIGQIDDLRIYDVAFTARQVLDLTEPYADGDDDGLMNVQEYQEETDPDDEDTDNDGMPDGWEARYYFNPAGIVEAPLCHWAFDGMSSVYFPDVAGGSIGGFVEIPQSVYADVGVHNEGLIFNAGSGQHGYVNQINTVLDVSGDNVSVACWYKAMESTTSTKYLAVKGGYWSANYGLAMDDDYVRFIANIGGMKYTPNVAESMVLPDGQWHYLVGVYDGVYLRVYIDGDEVSNLAVTGNLVPNGEGFMIGYNTAGLLDEVRLYNVALDETEVGYLMESGMDPDGDGVSNIEEFEEDTNPLVAE